MKTIQAYLFFFISLVISTFACKSGHYSHTEINRKSYAENYGFEEYGFSSKRESPITNREYLIFLCWNIEVYGQSFPDYVLSLFPINSLPNDDTLYLEKKPQYDVIFKYPRGILKHHILHPDYLDYPLTGLQPNQLQHLYRWMNDRYHENLLIDLKHLNFSPSQMDEDNFSVEAFLSGQYQGMVRRGPRPKWKDQLFLPAFRPPFGSELQYVKSVRFKNKYRPVWGPFPMDKSHFLNRWNDYYLKSDRPPYRLLLQFQEVTVPIPQNTILIKPRQHAFHLENPASYFQGIKYIEAVNQRQKDELGRMSFIIVGENTYGRPIVIEYPSFSTNSSSSERAIYWLYFDDELEMKYWP